MKLFLVFVCLMLLSFGFMIFDTLITQSLAGITIGLTVNLLWVSGRAQETAEYWNDTGPRWMKFVYRQLHKQNFLIQAKVQKYNIIKRLSLGIGLACIMGIIITRPDTVNWRITLISLLTTWILGICLSEWYIRRKFHRIDWRDL